MAASVARALNPSTRRAYNASPCARQAMALRGIQWRQKHGISIAAAAGNDIAGVARERREEGGGAPLHCLPHLPPPASLTTSLPPLLPPCPTHLLPMTILHNLPQPNLAASTTATNMGGYLCSSTYRVPLHLMLLPSAQWPLLALCTASYLPETRLPLLGRALKVGVRGRWGGRAVAGRRIEASRANTRCVLARLARATLPVATGSFAPHALAPSSLASARCRLPSSAATA